ncbi:MAG: FAD-dependent oxidoreductase [Deltaproteobacteria bacterium]|nr:FAD-dependent oxidoreductase [Deltaproteobacteria bacterium]
MVRLTLETLQEKPTDLLIVGGGITGLTAAYLAAKANHKVTLIEAGGRFGGLMRTAPVAGTALECFYHHFFTHDLELHWLLKELGLRDEVFYCPSTMGIFRNGKIFDFNGPLDLLAFNAIPLWDRIRFGATSLLMCKCLRWENWEGVPAVDWFYRYAGRQSTDAIWAPMLKIKFGSYSDQVPAAWMIGRLRQRVNSNDGGQQRLGYLKGSLDVLCTALVNRLAAMGVSLYANMPAQKLEVQAGQLTAVHSGDRRFAAQKFLFTIPTSAIHPLVEPVDTAFAGRLREVEYFGAVCVVLVLKRPLSHIYWLNIADAGFPFGGVIEHTNFIDPATYQNKHIVYLSRYFAAHEEIASQDEAAIKGQMLAALRRLNPLLNDAGMEEVFVFKTRTAANVCGLNFSKKIPRCTSPIKNMYLAGMPHIYPDERSCNNAIRVVAEACRVMELGCEDIPRGPSLAGRIAMA